VDTGLRRYDEEFGKVATSLLPAQRNEVARLQSASYGVTNETVAIFDLVAARLKRRPLFIVPIEAA